MRYLFLAITLAFLVGCGNVKQAYEEGYEDARATLESETPQLSVDLFDTEAGKFVDQQVAVSGIVDHVCKHSGKRLKLVTDGGSVHVDSEVRFDENNELTRAIVFKWMMIIPRNIGKEPPMRNSLIIKRC